ncbi:hypothetical protein D3C71_1852420 [compost metagenome]
MLGALEIDSTKTFTLKISQGNINLLTSGNLVIPSFGSVVSENGQNLGVSIDQKATAGISTTLSGGHNHGIPDGTQFKDVNGNVYTWSVAANHSHAQN